jgi:hypothetical protein
VPAAVIDELKDRSRSCQKRRSRAVWVCLLIRPDKFKECRADSIDEKPKKKIGKHLEKQKKIRAW